MALKRKGNVYYDFGTSNISFLQVAKDLKTNGIKNYYFHLILYNPALEGVDPHSELVNARPDLIMAIIQECILNPYYFIREVVRIPIQGGNGTPFILNRATLGVLWCFLHGIDSYITIARQIGKTQSLLSYILWAFLFGATNSDIGFLNIKQDRANANLTRLKDQYALLPKYLQQNFIINENGKIVEGKNNVQTLENIKNNNEIVTKGKANNEESADAIGRGSTEPIQYVDEFEFILYISKILKASGPAFATAHINAMKTGSATARLFSSTPGDLDSRAGADAVGIINKMYKFTEKFYDMTLEDVLMTLKKNSENQIVYIEFPYYLLGKDQEWFQLQCRLLDNNPVDIKREILLYRIHGSSQSPYDIEDLDAINEMKGKIREEHFINKIYKLDLYDKLDPTRVYFVGIDIADGYGADNTAIIIFDPYKLKVVGEFKSPYISPSDLRNLCLTLVMKFIPNAILIPERNRGAALISDLLQSPIRHRLFSEQPKTFDNEFKYDDNGMMKIEAKRRQLQGVATTTVTRPLMFGLLEVYVREHKEAFVSEGLINELFSLIRKTNGKIEAMNGAHDDIVMAFLMCLYVYYHGKNLSRYGFYPNELPSESERNKGVNPDEELMNIQSLLSENDAAFFANTSFSNKTMNDLDMEYMKEMINIRKQMEYQTSTLSSFDVNSPITNMNTPLDFSSYIEESIPDTFFDDLNSDNLY